MLTQARNYAPGNTDLSWTRLTPWRALLAAALDQYPARVKCGPVAAERVNPSADLLVAWLCDRLKVDVERRSSKGPGITSVGLMTGGGEIEISPPDGLLAEFAIPNAPTRPVALKRRELAELLAEELRRLDPDDVYGTVHAVQDRHVHPARRPSKAQAPGSPCSRHRRDHGRRRSAAKKAAGQGCGEEDGPQDQPRSRGQEVGRSRQALDEHAERARAPQPGRAGRGRLRAADHHAGRRAVRGPGAALGADGRHDRRPHPRAPSPRPRPATPSTGRASSSGGATSASCPADDADRNETQARAGPARPPASRPCAGAPDARRPTRSPTTSTPRRPPTREALARGRAARGPRRRADLRHRDARRRSGRPRRLAVPRAAGSLRVERTVIGVRGSPKPPPTAVTLTMPALARAREVWFVASGEEKAKAVHLALAGRRHRADPRCRAAGTQRTLWLLDQAAASQLPRGLARL